MTGRQGIEQHNLPWICGEGALCNLPVGHSGSCNKLWPLPANVACATAFDIRCPFCGTRVHWQVDDVDLEDGVPAELEGRRALSNHLLSKRCADEQ